MSVANVPNELNDIGPARLVIPVIPTVPPLLSVPLDGRVWIPSCIPVGVSVGARESSVPPSSEPPLESEKCTSVNETSNAIEELLSVNQRYRGFLSRGATEICCRSGSVPFRSSGKSLEYLESQALDPIGVIMGLLMRSKCF
jgi:hypothetical protein